MDNAQFQLKIRQWLEGHDPVNARWSLERTSDPNTVTVSAFIKKNLILGTQDPLRVEIKCYSSTEDSEDTIHSAVLAINESILNRL